VPRYRAGSGILIEGADTNVIIRNHYPDYLTGDWTKTNITDTEVTTPDLYNGGSIRLVTGGAAGQLTQQQTLTQEIEIIQALVYTDGTPVTSADMEMYASGEILTNGGFEVDLSGWTMVGISGGTGSGVQDVVTTHGGSAGSLKLTHSNALGYYVARQSLVLINGRNYDVSCYVYIPSADVPSDHVRLKMENFTNEASIDANLGITDAWQQLTISNWDPGAIATGNITVRLKDSAGGGGAFVYFDDVSITEVNPNIPTTFEPVGNGVSRAWGIFTGGANPFDLGVEVKANKTVCKTLLTVYPASVLNQGGLFPRSPIPNATAGAVARLAENWAAAADDNIGLSEGTIDAAFIAPCSEADARANLHIFSIYKDATHEIHGYFDHVADRMGFEHEIGVTSRIIFGAMGFARGDLVKVRVLFDAVNTIDGTNYFIVYYSVNNAAWVQLGVDAVALGGAMSAGATINVGQDGTADQYLGSFVGMLRVYDRAILGLPGW